MLVFKQCSFVIVFLEYISDLNCDRNQIQDCKRVVVVSETSYIVKLADAVEFANDLGCHVQLVLLLLQITQRTGIAPFVKGLI